MANPKSIFSRKRDLAYLVFFLIHIPVLLCKSQITQRLLQIHEYPAFGVMSSKNHTKEN
jgi:hypothetical protein